MMDPSSYLSFVRESLTLGSMGAVLFRPLPLSLGKLSFPSPANFMYVTDLQNSRLSKEGSDILDMIATDVCHKCVTDATVGKLPCATTQPQFCQSFIFEYHIQSDPGSVALGFREIRF